MRKHLFWKLSKRIISYLISFTDKIFSISSTNRRVDSAQSYKNEAEVAEAIRASGVPNREDIFVNECRSHLLPSIRAYLVLLQPLNVCQTPITQSERELRAENSGDGFKFSF